MDLPIILDICVFVILLVFIKLCNIQVAIQVTLAGNAEMQNDRLLTDHQKK